MHWARRDERSTCGALDPQPTKVVANLPYGIAAGVLLRTIEELRGVSSWVAMVQREVGERLAALPGSRAYGTPSVIAQLECEVEVRAGDPAHRVPSGAERRLGAASRLRRPRSRAASRSGHLAARCGRSSAARSPTGARRSRARSRCPGGRGGRSREQVREALERLGHPADVRAERLSPEDFRALARLLEL